MFVIPFAKSAVTSLHTPDNTNHAFLQLDDGLLVYRGADQPDMSVINPESDVWQSIKVLNLCPLPALPSSDAALFRWQLPAGYISNNWPIRYACISADARLIAVAGRRGLVHYNSLSGRWKLFDNDIQEQSFKVQGGMQWYGSTLIVTAEELDEQGQPIHTVSILALPSRKILKLYFSSVYLPETVRSIQPMCLTKKSCLQG